MVQTTFAVVNVFYKLAADDGMNLSVLIAYRFIFAAAFMLPLAFFVKRNKRTRLTWTVIFQAFLCGLFGGSLAQNMYLQGLALTSATFATATMNLIPAMTFVLAIIFGLEMFDWGEAAGKAKVIGTFLGVIGAMLLTFYKGPNITIWKPNIDLLKNSQEHHGGSVAKTYLIQILGAFLAISGTLCNAIWLILQAKMQQEYPCPYSMTALMNIMAAIQATIYALVLERDWTQWHLGWNIRLLTTAYSGIIASGFIFTVLAWCVKKRGPIFVSAFSPFMLLVVVIAGFLVLDENLHLGSLFGAVMIVCGLYVVLWGKEKQMEEKIIPI
ncbi:Plant-drug/metabolite exporter [Heracleum sosnowskyi]|uniref:WAT1-related protein n=1 Tax=Heracleum sosnowskyi TaxID=360622 RepID=A0AAD8JF81_9APIA|nr:Plant-drug/metabolite exporter [Heracleum sosnowskyi]